MFRIGEEIMHERDNFSSLWQDLKYMVGSKLRRGEGGDWKPQLEWLLSDQMGVDDINRHIYLTDLLHDEADEIIDDMENKLLHYANVTPEEVTAHRLIDFYRTLPERLKDDARIYGIAGSDENKNKMGRGL